jgi:hypothetical protein
LDNALRNVFVEDYEELYNKATEIFKKFKDTAKLNIKMVPKDVFLSRVSATEKTRDLPSLENSWALKEFLLPKIIQNSNDFGVMQEIIRWLSDR